MRHCTPAAVETLESRRLMSVSAAVTPPGTISGVVFNDTNANGVLDKGEAPVSGRTVYLDSNNDGKLDSKEPSVKTAANGKFQFSHLAAGAYTVREVTPAATRLTLPKAGFYRLTLTAAKPAATANFGETPILPTVSYAGQYLVGYNGSIVEVDLRPVAGSKTQYTGDVVYGDLDLKLTAMESYANVLTGQIAEPKGKPVPFTATLKGTTLTEVDSGITTKLSKVSGTPAPPPPALVARNGTLFNYESPNGWTVSEGQGGIVLNSADKTEQVGVLATYNDGIFGVNQILRSQQQSGATLKYRQALQDGYVSSSLYEQAEADLLTFTYKGKSYASAELVETLTNLTGGAYDPSTGSYTGQTLTLIEMVTAPKQFFVADVPTLETILGSVHFKTPTAAQANAERASAGRHFLDGYDYGSYGFYDPGIEGDWSNYGGFNYDSNPWLYDEQSSLADSSASMDTEVDNFCDYLLS